MNTKKIGPKTKVAISNSTTVYQNRILSPDSVASVIKEGKNNKKLGTTRIKKGPWKGLYIYSLTLVERETCPKSCIHWSDCYGNNLHLANRHTTNNLIPKLESDLERIMGERKNKKGIALRLHILGDFYSAEYVKFWESMLLNYPKLRIFGFTARMPETTIGKQVRLINLRYSERCIVRFSANKVSESLNSYAAEESFEGDNFVCPSTKENNITCASCAACWNSKKTVKFITH